MWPHTINNNCLHSLKDFLRQKCLPYQYCPLLPPLPAVLWYHIWRLCAQGDFQPLKRWAGWEWASDLWAAFSLTVWEESALCTTGWHMKRAQMSFFSWIERHKVGLTRTLILILAYLGWMSTEHTLLSNFLIQTLKFSMTIQLYLRLSTCIWSKNSIVNN